MYPPATGSQLDLAIEKVKLGLEQTQWRQGLAAVQDEAVIIEACCLDAIPSCSRSLTCGVAAQAV